jgi:hypothetical protein
VLVEGLPPGPPQVPLAFHVPQVLGVEGELDSEELEDDGHEPEEVGQDSEDGGVVELLAGVEELLHTPLVSGLRPN